MNHDKISEKDNRSRCGRRFDRNTLAPMDLVHTNKVSAAGEIPTMFAAATAATPSSATSSTFKALKSFPAPKAGIIDTVVLNNQDTAPTK